MDKREWAVELARRGFRVFKLPIGQKFPPPKDFPRIATRDPDEVYKLWTAPSGAAYRWNIGIATDEWVVADIDTKEGRRGLESADALGLDFRTFTVRTPTGGMHLYYRDVGPVSNRAGLLGEDSGLDVRGWHGYVVGPGSETNDGAYELARDAEILAPPPLFAERLRAPAERSSDAPVGELDTPAKIDQAIHYLDHEPPGTTEPDVYRVCAKLRAIGITPELALELIQTHWIKRCPGWEDGCDEDWLAARIDHADKYGIGAPGSEAFELVLAGIDVPEEVKKRPKFGRWDFHGDTPEKPYGWSFYRILPDQGTTMLFGPSGAGKTFLLAEIARCLATDRAFFGETAYAQGGTAFVTGGTEGALFHERMAALGESRRLPIAHMNVPSLRGEEVLAGLLEELKVLSVHMTAEFGVPLRLVVFDTFNALNIVEDINDNGQVSVAVAALGRIGKELGAPVLFTHHPKKEDSIYSGAQAFEGAPDCILEIAWEGRAQRALKLRKARGAPRATIGTFTLVPAPLGFDQRGNAIESCWVSTGTAVIAGGKRPSSAASRVLEVLETVFGGEEGVVEFEGRRGVTEDALFEVFCAGSKAKLPEEQYQRAVREAIAAHMIIEFIGPNQTVFLAPNQGL